MGSTFSKKGFFRSPFHFFCCLIILLLAGCAAKEPPKAVLQPRGDGAPVRIAVLPFQRVLPDQSMRTVVCPVSGLLYRACDSPVQSEKILENHFLERLPKAYQRNLISIEKADGVYRRISTGSFKASPQEVLRKVGEELDADAVLAGYLYCFRERVGNDYSVKNPASAASVTFGLYLYRVSDGALVWKGIFDKTQRSLFENVLEISSFVKGGGKWVPAEVLLADGVEEVLKSFPELH